MSVAPEVIQKINVIAVARTASRLVRRAGSLGRNINDVHRAARRVATFASASRRMAARYGAQVGTGFRIGRAGMRDTGTIGSRVGQALGRASRAPGAVRNFGAGAVAGIRGGERAYNRARDVGLGRSYLGGARVGVTLRNAPSTPLRTFGARARTHGYINRQRLALHRELTGGKVTLTAARARARTLDGMEEVNRAGAAFRDRATRARTLLEQRLVTRPASGQRVWQSGFYERDGTWNRGRWRLIPGTN